MRTVLLALLFVVALVSTGCSQGNSGTAVRPDQPAVNPAPPLQPIMAPPVVLIHEPPPAAPAWQPIIGKTVILDPGHGGHDNGAHYFGLKEKDVNLDLALRTAKILGAMGIRVRLTRQTDAFISLEDRSAFANRNPNAAFVSIHCNASAANANASGIETFVLSRQFSDAEQSRKALARYSVTGQDAAKSRQSLDALTRASRAEGPVLAAAVQRSAVARLGDVNRGVKSANLAVLRETFFCPAILVEVGFLSHYPTNRKMASAPWRDLAAQALAEGIASYLRRGG